MKKALSPLLCLSLLLAGCGRLPAAREMGDMALLRTMGVDEAPGGVAVTVSTGPRAKGLQGEGEAALVLSARDRSLSGACLAMQGLSDSYVFFGYVDQLLLGEGLAKGGVRPVLDYFSRDAELGLGAQLWLVRGSTAGEAVASGGREGVDGRLSTLQTDGKMGVAAISRTAGEIYTDLEELGAAFVPALAVAGADDTSLTESGYAVLRDFRLAGWLEGEAARGLELLAGRPLSDVLEFKLPGGRVALRLTAAHTGPVLTFRGGEPSGLKLTCRLEAELAEYEYPPTREELAQLSAALEGRARVRLEEALARLQGWGADCVGLGARAAMSCPREWQDIQGDWPQWFERLELELDVRATIHQ